MREKIFAGVFILVLFASAANVKGQDMFANDLGTKKSGDLKLEHILDKMVNSTHADSLAKEYDINFKDNAVQVIIDLKQVSPQYLEALKSAGATIEIYDKNLVQAHVPVSMLKAIADLPFVNYVRKPEKYMSFVTSEGVATINATAMHNLGYNGSGVKIAVLDLGFSGYQSKLGTELPSSVTVMSFRADGDITGGNEVHGTAVAETVHDVAPGAQLYLVNYGTMLEMNRAVDWLISQNVDIISHSAGTSLGPKDGTDYDDGIVNKAVAAGILWVNAAGNEADEHWMGNFNDPDGNGWHNFASTDETNDIFADAGSTIEVLLDWDDWPYSNQDYDLYLLNDTLGTVTISDNIQTGTQPPYETISYIAQYTGYYHIAIKKYNATRNVKFHLYTPHNPSMEYKVPSGSIAIPGTSTGSLTVGATDWLNDALEPYSSQGPTDDGRIKPDITAPDNTTNAVYTQLKIAFRGTSASAPHASGAAALLLQMNPRLNVSQLKQALENGAKDLGAPGKDNQFGAGRIDVYSSAQLLGSATTFTLTNGIIALPDSMGRRNATITVQLKDSAGNNVSEARNVTFTISSGTLSASSGTTNASTGRLDVTLSGNTTSGAVLTVITASISGLSPANQLLMVSIPMPSLTVAANTSSVIVNVSTPLLFTVTTGSTKVEGAAVTLTGAGISTGGTTDSGGNVTIIVNATGQGIISVTTGRIGYAGGNVTVTVMPPTAAQTLGIANFSIPANGTFTVPIIVVAPVGGNIGTADIILTYNPAVITVVNATDVASTDYTLQAVNPASGMTRILAVNSLGKGGISTIANVKFTAAGAAGSTSAVNISLTLMTDANGVPVVPAITNGIATVTSAVIRGDVNGNGARDVVDVLFTLQTVAGLRQFTAAQITAADVNGNRALDVGDGLFIAQAVAGLRQL